MAINMTQEDVWVRNLDFWHFKKSVGFVNTITFYSHIRPDREANGRPKVFYYVAAEQGGKKIWSVINVKSVSLATAKKRAAALIESGENGVPKRNKNER